MATATADCSGCRPTGASTAARASVAAAAAVTAPTVAEGIANGVRYESDPAAILEAFLQGSYRAIRDKELSDGVRAFSLTRGPARQAAAAVAEDFGKDGRYTLGEPFLDNNRDGAYTPGVDTWIAAQDDVAGVPARTFQCRIEVPKTVVLGKAFYWRFRLDHGENATAGNAVIRYAILPEGEDRSLAGNRGGTWWGEVEDYPSRAVVLPPAKDGEPVHEEEE